MLTGCSHLYISERGGQHTDECDNTAQRAAGQERLGMRGEFVQLLANPEFFFQLLNSKI